jgi:methylated-DNA-[protein]-cysteine S-methyltransferase
MIPITTWTLETSPIGRLRVAATPAGLCKISLGHETEAHFETWLSRHFPSATLVEAETGWVAQALEQIVEYLAGSRHTFDLGLDVRGTDFQRIVWTAVARIPYAHTRSYASIAAAIGRPSACRAVGAANGANPLPLVIPCHRVIGKNGALTGYRGGVEIKRSLLDLERGHVAAPGSS